MSCQLTLSEDDPERIAQTIVHTAPISSKKMSERHKTRFQKQEWLDTDLEQDIPQSWATITVYNIYKAKRTLWLLNSVSTVCPWVYTADSCANVYKANILTDIISKVMVNVHSARNVKLSSQLSEDETECPSFNLFGNIFPEPPAKRLQV